MKVILLCALALLGIAVTSAQTVPRSTGPGIAVVKFSWIKERVGLEGDSFTGSRNPEEAKVPAGNDKKMIEPKKGGTTPEADRTFRDSGNEALKYEINQNTTARYRFVYKTFVQNTGSKTAKVIDWDYVFIDSQTKTELGRKKFSSAIAVAPGKSKELKFLTVSPPVRMVSVKSLSKNERTNLEETVVIVRVEYMDGSVWQLPER